MKHLKLSTEVQVGQSDWKIGHSSGIITIGSCFAEVLGRQLTDYKFPVLNNSFGTIFNPLAIAKVLDYALEGKSPHPGLYHENSDNIWLHHDFHSSQWATSREKLETLLAEKLTGLRDFFKTAGLLVITLGTAYAYRHRATNVIVGNCHKIAADHFMKELLNPDQIAIGLEHVLFKLQTRFRDLKIILTVSPVRHTRDTLPLNQVSKSTLRLVCHRLSEKFKQVGYFPSYEIMIDELRDYRFYEEDLIHPNKVAEDYIFRTFANAFVDHSSMNFMNEWDSVQKMMGHRPLHGLTPGHYKLLKAVEQKLTELSGSADLSEELSEINRRISEFPSPA